MSKSNKLPKKIIDVIRENTIDANCGPEDTEIWDTDIFKNFDVAYKEHWGGENQGSDYGYIYQLTDKKTKKEHFVKMTGYYQSYVGTDWSEGDVAEVKQVEVKRLEWEEI